MVVINGYEIVQNFLLDQYKGKKYVVFFFYLMDFIFVCFIELYVFQEKFEEFEKCDVVVVGCLVDFEYFYFFWLQMFKNEGGIQGVKYFIVFDFFKLIFESYGVLVGSYVFDENGNWVCEGILVVFCGLFLIDKEGVVRYCVINDLLLGCNVDEVLCMVDVL